MAKQNAVNLDVTNNADGWDATGGTTGRKLTVTGGDVALTGSGSAVITFPGSTSTLATLALTEEFDNKTLDSSVGKGTWTASGTWTLPAMTFGGNVTMAENAGIILDVILSADGKYSGIVQAGIAGATLAFGDLCYLDTSVPEWLLADASAAGTAGTPKLGICVLAAADTAATTMLVFGAVRADVAFPTFTAGQIYASETAGDVTNTAPTTTDAVIRVLGHALTGDAMFFNPDNTYITHT